MDSNAISRNSYRAGEAALSILKAHYPIVLTLQCHLQKVLRSEDFDGLLNGSDPQRYTTLLTTSYVASYVAIAECPNQTGRFVAAPPMSHMRDVGLAAVFEEMALI